MQAHIAGLINAVHIAKASGDAEFIADFAKSFKGKCDISGLRVKFSVVNACIIHAVLFTARAAKLYFKANSKLAEPFKIALAGA